MRDFIKGIILGTLVISLSASVRKSDICKKGDIYYSVADYKEEIFIKKEYSHLFDKLLHKPVFNCFCKNNIKNLPSNIKKEEGKRYEEDHIIEPLIVDLATNNGLYAKRIYTRGGRNPRFRCGFYHFLFILSDNSYHDFSSDSIANVELIKAKLSKTFDAKELVTIIEEFANDNIVCDHFTYFPPLYIKKGKEVLFDAYKLSEEKAD